MLPSTSAWSAHYGPGYPSVNSMNGIGGDRGHPAMSMASPPPSHWLGSPSSHPRRLPDPGFLPPSAVDLRYPGDWSSASGLGASMCTMSPRSGGVGYQSVKDELTDPSDYSSEDTCSDYREPGINGRADFGGELGERSRRTTEKKNENDELLTPEEAEKRRVRRERNKLAAARCRQRRVDLTNQLLAETETLEDERDRLQKEIQALQRQRSQLEDLLGTHAPRCQSRTMVNSQMMDIPQIKTEKCDDYFNMADTGLCRAPCNSYAPPPTIFQSCSRPDSLPLASRRPVALTTTLTQTTTGQNIAGITNLGLDCMLDGHTGLTPITGAPPVPDQVDCVSGYSPTTLMTL